MGGEIRGIVPRRAGKEVRTEAGEETEEEEDVQTSKFSNNGSPPDIGVEKKREE